MTTDEFSLALKTQEKAFEKAKQRYAQGGKKPLLSYLKRLRTWAHAGLPFQINSIDDFIISLKTELISAFGGDHKHSEPCQNQKRKYSYGTTSFLVSICSDLDGNAFYQKGKPTCIKNFSRHYSSRL